MASETGNFSERVVLITGGSRGIGFELARAFAAGGARVAITARQRQTLEAALDRLRSLGAEAMGLLAEVADPERAVEVVSSVSEALGPPDVLINNAGVFGVEGPFAQNDLDAWWRTVEVNLRGPVVYARAVLDAMPQRGSGVIINLASHAAIQASPANSSYAASKAALLRFTDSLAESVRDRGVRVFAVSPGLVRTDMTRGVPRLEAVPADGWRPISAVTRLVTRLVLEAGMDLTGGYYHVDDDLDAILERGGEVRDSGLYRLARATLPEHG